MKKAASVRSSRVYSLFLLLATSQVTSLSVATAQPQSVMLVPRTAPAAARPKVVLENAATAPKADGTTTLKSEGAPKARKAVKAVVAKSPGITAPTFGDFKMMTALKNTITAGRKYELEEIGGKNFAMKNELFMGLKHKSGWSFQVSGAVGQQSFADSHQNSRGWKDASVVLGHPALYSGDVFELGGQLRQYIPTTNSSRENNFIRTAYYSFADWTLPSGFAVSNTFFPNRFSQKNMKPEDADALIYDSLELTHKTAKGITLGFGQQTQIEHHVGTASGTTVEVYPFMDITLIPNVLIEPKFYMPVFVRGLVGGAPEMVSMAQTQAELYIKMAF